MGNSQKTQVYAREKIAQAPATQEVESQKQADGKLQAIYKKPFQVTRTKTKKQIVPMPGVVPVEKSKTFTMTMEQQTFLEFFLKNFEIYESLSEDRKAELADETIRRFYDKLSLINQCVNCSKSLLQTSSPTTRNQEKVTPVVESKKKPSTPPKPQSSSSVKKLVAPPKPGSSSSVRKTTTPPKSEAASNVKKLVAPAKPKPGSSSSVRKTTTPPKSEAASNVAPPKPEAEKSVTKQDAPEKPEAASKVQEPSAPPKPDDKKVIKEPSATQKSLDVKSLAKTKEDGSGKTRISPSESYELQTSFRVETHNQYLYDKSYGVVIVCSDYSKVLMKDGKQRFADMPEVVQEGEDMITGLKQMNFEIIHKVNPSKKNMDDLFLDLNDKAVKAIKKNERLLFFFYYTGHGKIKDQTYMVVNEPDFKKYMFPFERKVRNLSLQRNTNVVTLLDCCRQAVSKGEDVPFEKVVHLKNSKGDMVDDDVAQAIEQAYRDDELFTITFGCKPNYGVLRGSSLGPQYLSHLEMFAKKNNGRVIMPMALVDFIDKQKNAETTIKCPMQSVLTWGEPDPANAEVKVIDVDGQEWLYQGPVKNRKPHGAGRANQDAKVYIGKFEKGQKHDEKGIIQFPNGDSFCGRFKEDKKCGEGKLTYVNGDVSQGEYVDDHFVKGFLKQANGSTFDGEFKDDKPYKGRQLDANGVLEYELTWNGNIETRRIFKDGKKETEIDYKQGRYHGKYLKYFSNEKVHIDAEYKEGKYHGKRIENYENGKKEVDIDYALGQYHGKRLEYSDNGQCLIDAGYKNGEYDGKRVEKYENGKKKLEFGYKEGKFHGNCANFFETGKPESAIDYVDGELTGKSRKYDENGSGKLRKETDYVKGVIHGQLKTFYPNGNKQCITDYKEGTQHGKLLAYFEKSSKLEGDIDFREGKKHGKQLVYHSNGKLSEDIKFSEGKKHGKHLAYYNDGKLKEDVEFKQDKNHGKALKYDASGRIEEDIEYKEGKYHGKYLKYHPDGGGKKPLKVKEDIDYINGNKHGEDKQYADNGTLIKQAGYSGGILHGKYSEYLPDGTVQQQIDYAKGSKHGKYQVYFKNGKLEKEFEYKMDKLHGKCIEYSAKSGQVHSETNYQDEQFHGQKLEYHPNGKLKEYKNFKEGKKHGNFITYFETGEKQLEIMFVEGKAHGKIKWFSKDGTLNSETDYLNGKKHGKELRYHYNKQVENDIDWIEDKKHGKSLQYYSDGQIKLDFSFKEGQKHGKCLQYLEDGKTKEDIDFQADKQNGKALFYYKNGQLEWDQEKKDDLYHGKVIHYDDKGEVIFEGQFKDDVGKGRKKFKRKTETKELGYELIVYEGEFKHDTICGQGRMEHKNGDIWEGIFKKSDYRDRDYREGKKEVKNGRCVEHFIDGQIQEDATYSNGKRDGKHLAYYGNGQLMYEQEFKDGIYHGKVRHFSEKGELTLEGQFINGKGKGFIKETRESFLKVRSNYTRVVETIDYEGELKDDKPHGQGRRVYDSADIWEGQWENGEKGKANGKCTSYHKNGQVKLEEQWKDGLYHGKVLGFDDKGEKVSDVDYTADVGKGYNKKVAVRGLLFSYQNYEGEFLHDQPHGKGRCISCISSSGEIVEGTFNKSSLVQKHGRCLQHHSNGQVERDEEWKDNLKHGKCISHYENGQVERDEEWKDNLLHGKVLGFNEKGEKICEIDYIADVGKGFNNQQTEIIGERRSLRNVTAVYQGEFLGNEQQGQGRAVYENGDIWEGTWEKGAKKTANGRCLKHHSNGQIEKDEQWKDGLYHGKVIGYSEKGDKISEVDYKTDVGKGYKKKYSAQVNYSSEYGNFEGEFLHDEPHGLGKFTTELGGVQQGTWDKGTLKTKNGVCISYHKNGQVKLEEQWKDGLYHGKVVGFDDKGEKICEIDYNADVGKGYNKKYYYELQDSNKYEYATYEGEFLHEEPHGQGRIVLNATGKYHAAGDSSQGTWNEGKLEKKNGKCVNYHSNGQVKRDEEWKDNLLHGKVLGFNEEGEKTCEIEYNADVGKGYDKELFLSYKVAKYSSKFDWVHYEGEYLHNDPQGEGRIETTKGYVWAGTWKKGNQDKETK